MILSVIRVTIIIFGQCALQMSHSGVLNLYNFFKDFFVDKWGAAFSHSLLRHFYFHSWSYMAFLDTKKALREYMAAQAKANTKKLR